MKGYAYIVKQKVAIVVNLKINLLADYANLNVKMKKGAKTAIIMPLQ